MDNYKNDNTARRYTAHVSILGTTQLHKRNPYAVAWWSAAFPGFGHLLLSKYLRGFVLFVWEVIVNLQSHINIAIAYSFQGNFESAISVLDTRWVLLYTPVYFFGIWDSYRTTVDLNKIYILAEREQHTFNTFSIAALEINYLDKRNPIMSAIWSLFIPGLGQLYIHRIVTASFVIIWSLIFLYFSHSLEAIVFLFLGDIQQSTAVLDVQWFLFLPSTYGFSIYDSYVNTIENNKLFEKEQRKFLKDNYQQPNFQIIKGKKVK
ncbi:hypothetical protein CR203_13785 [Salipaludibacillus neizhouensis]|uniref:Uncharacterized protein n=1 Tax=Salipaludibacillus neizhouensis TaxID=885475 RepID=A0A3A9KGY8_9BACI|nr:hypothetical protein [Salipaludibacillus neizhouensis]RKL66895.1 hypothetical protein CR203_13785 [Salipaludibacillus neizhouensis]